MSIAKIIIYASAAQLLLTISPLPINVATPTQITIWNGDAYTAVKLDNAKEMQQSNFYFKLMILQVRNVTKWLTNTKGITSYKMFYGRWLTPFSSSQILELPGCKMVLYRAGFSWKSLVIITLRLDSVVILAVFPLFLPVTWTWTVLELVHPFV